MGETPQERAAKVQRANQDAWGIRSVEAAVEEIKKLQEQQNTEDDDGGS